jgi:hypothetical protein
MYGCLSSEEGIMEVGDGVGDMIHHDDANCRGLTYYTTHINAEGFYQCDYICNINTMLQLTCTANM